MKDSGLDGVVQDKPGVETIARQLTGELICIGCGYNLRGLSIRGVCPECEMSIRATLLGIVDPQAEELEDLSMPGMSAYGILLWSVGALIACLAVWVLRIDEIVRAKSNVSFGFVGWAGLVGLIALIVSGFGALTMIRPYRHMGRWMTIRAAIGVSAYIPVALVYAVIYRGFDQTASMRLINPGSEYLERSMLRLGMFVGVALIIWGIRPNALKLAMRSVIVRTGRVDRQSIYAVLASFGVAAIGDVFNIVGILSGEIGGFGGVVGDLLMQFHVVLVAFGSVLITLGLVNIVVDCVRLRPVLMHRGVGLSDVFETNREKEAREGGS